MKTKFYLTVITALTIVAFTSCKKDSPGRHGGFSEATTTTINLNATVKAGDTYRLNLNLYGNGAASITRQASAYNVSQISVDGSGNKVYQYVSSLNPKSGSNTDEVVLKISSTGQSSGGCHNHEGNNESNGSSEKTINIKFTVN